MKLLTLILLISNSAFASSSNWICLNPEGESLSIKAKETEFTPFVKVTSKHHTISGFVHVLERKNPMEQRWSLKFNTNIALYMNFKNNEVTAFWRLSNSMNYSCEKEL